MGVGGRCPGSLAATAWGQYPGSVRPATRLALPVSDPLNLSIPPAVTELPPVLAEPKATVTPTTSGLPCPIDYQPHHAYLPDQGVMWGTGGCDGECGPCRQAWLSTAFFFGCLQDLGDVTRGFAYGVRVGGGYWFSPDKTTGVDLSLFNSHDTYKEVLAVGTMTTSPVTLTTADANYRSELMTYEKWRFDGLVGYRYLQLHEKLTVFTPTTITDTAARNEVHAAQVGVLAEYRIGSYFTEMMAKLAVGRNSTAVTVNGVRTTDSVLCWVPELGIRCGYQLGQGCWGTFGYTFLYASNVERPGRSESDFFLHGLLVGIEWRF